MPKLFEVFWVFQMYVCEYAEGPSKRSTYHKKSTTFPKKLGNKKTWHGNFPQKYFFLNACLMQFEQFDVLTKAFKSFVGKVYFFYFFNGIDNSISF